MVSSTLPAPTADGVQRRPQPPTSHPAGQLPIQRHRALHQPPIQLVRDQPGTEGTKRRLRKRRGRMIHAVQHQLPAPIHHTGLDHLIIRSAGVGLQDRRQPKLRWRHGRLPHRLVLIHLGKLGLEALVEQLVTVLAQPHKQLRPLDPLDGLPFQPRAGPRRLPHPWTHHSHHPPSGRDTLVPLKAATYPIQIPVRLSRAPVKYRCCASIACSDGKP
jgi:hypothetical protein